MLFEIACFFVTILSCILCFKNKNDKHNQQKNNFFNVCINAKQNFIFSTAFKMKQFLVLIFIFLYICVYCINGNICKSYNSSTEIFTDDITLDLAYDFTDKSFILTITNFTAAVKTNVTVESYSADTQTQTCE